MQPDPVGGTLPDSQAQTFSAERELGVVRLIREVMRREARRIERELLARKAS